MMKRGIAFVLCLSMIFSLIVPVAFVFANTEVLSIEYDGFYAENISINYDEKKTLSAVMGNSVPENCQWQILVDSEGGIWADIYDKTAAECEVSYPLVKSMVEDFGKAVLRCKVRDENGWIYSNEVEVRVTFNEKQPEETETGPVLVSDMEVLAFQEEEASEETEETGIFTEEISRVSAPVVLAEGEGEEDETEYVTITIKYLDFECYGEDEEIAIYSSYVATIEKGSAFKQEVLSPTYLGFAPYYDADADGNVEEDASVFHLDFAEGDLEEDVEYLVYYKPILVPYGVRYFFQNVNDDLYTEKAEYYHTHEALTGTIIDNKDFDDCTAITKDTTGFELMYHIPDSVAADGSTVFELYYDRHYYLIQFDFAGGYGSDPIYARYGTPFVVNDPVRHGYVFVGWDADGDGKTDEMPGTIPAEDRKYTAIWETADTTYTVVYWKENADDNGYSYWGYKSFDAQSGDEESASDNIPQEVHDGEKVHFEFNEVLSDKNVLVEGDGTTIVNAYYTRKYYTITFKDTNYSCLIPGTHTHTDACYAYKCEGAHVHTNACIICESEAHSHIDSCYVCGKEKHSHSEDCCTSTQHTHTVSCWANVGEKYNGTPYNAPRNPSQGQIYKRNYYQQRYIYIGDSWYYYNVNLNSDTVVDPNCDGHVHGVDECNIGCGKEEHSHSDGCGTNCGKTAHVHNDSCYNCNFGTHTHDASCERIVCGYSETHTHTNSCKNTVKKAYKKYQQSLADIWPIVADNGKTYNSGERWSPSGSDIYNNVLVYISNMPGEDFTLSLSTSNNDPRTMNYYLQALPGESYDVEKDGKYYKLDFTIVAKYGYITEAEDFFDINGYKQYDSDPDFSNGQISDSTLDRYNDTANFYYDRITDHYLVFNNNGIVNDDDKVYGIPYGATINQHNFTPEYPKNLEPNAYEFAGWYTSPGCFPGTEVNWDTITMPVGDLILYAKWEPVKHEVLFFEDLDAMNAYIAGDTSVATYKEYSVEHGEVIGPVEGPVDRWENPEDEGDNDKKLVFSGWFYIEGGEKKAFTPADFPIKKDMKIFADWGGTTHTPFRISYFTYENGEKVKVADDYTGFAMVGSTKTFNAKAGSPLNQLYPKYNNDAYFPLIASHSITMQYDSAKYAEDATENVFEFEYVKAEIPIKYTVKYVDKETGRELSEEYINYTEQAVVTERFRAIEGYIPDAFYKRLVISVEYDEEKKEFVGNDEENVIIFYYTPNTTSAYYAVHFMQEKLGATEEQLKNFAIDGTGGYESTGTHIEGIGDVDSTVEITPQIFPGFTLIDNKGIEIYDLDADGEIESGEMTTDKTLNADGEYEIKITKNGTELYIFYNRNSYPYSVYYYLYNTKDPVPNGTDSNGNTTYEPHKTGNTAKYGSEVTEQAVKIPGYTCVSATEQSLLIREETAQNRNEIIFYYSPTKYTVEYKAIPPEGGTLSSTIEVITGQDDFTGSVPTANAGWKFEGWYTNEDCTVAVCDSDGTVDQDTKQFVPNKDELSETESNIFYAKFVPDVAPLTIIRENPCDSDQVYVYEISWKNEGGETESITVTISEYSEIDGKLVGSVTVQNLTLGKEYTVTQINGWSWRNSDLPKEIVHEGNPDAEGNLQGTTVTFSDAETKPKWLNGFSALIKNIFTIIAGD